MNDKVEKGSILFAYFFYLDGSVKEMPIEVERIDERTVAGHKTSAACRSVSADENYRGYFNPDDVDVRPSTMGPVKIVILSNPSRAMAEWVLDRSLEDSRDRYLLVQRWPVETGGIK